MEKDFFDDEDLERFYREIKAPGKIKIYRKWDAEENTWLISMRYRDLPSIITTSSGCELSNVYDTGIVLSKYFPSLRHCLVLTLKNFCEKLTELRTQS